MIHGSGGINAPVNIVHHSFCAKAGMPYQYFSINPLPLAEFHKDPVQALTTKAIITRNIVPGAFLSIKPIFDNFMFFKYITVA